MATLLVDSCVIFDALNGKRGRGAYLQQLLEAGHLLACCPVNITEVYAGLHDHETARTQRFLASLEFLPVSAEIAMAAGLLKREWARKGRTLAYPDITIAAVAIFYGTPLLTDNKKDFPMPDLDLYTLPD